jgi:hypothetical protein
MTENSVAVCPGCAGPFLVEHPAGPLTCRHVGYCSFFVTGRPHPVLPLALFIRLQPVADGIVHRAPSLWDTYAGKPVREIKD